MQHPGTFRALRFSVSLRRRQHLGGHLTASKVRVLLVSFARPTRVSVGSGDEYNVPGVQFRRQTYQRIHSIAATLEIY